MDGRQIGLRLALDFLGIPINRDGAGGIANYREICDVVYIAKTRKLDISPSRVEFNPETGQAYSPLGFGDSKMPRWNLYRDLEEMALAGKEELNGWTFDAGITKKLESLKVDLNAKGLKALLKEAAPKADNKP